VTAPASCDRYGMDAMVKPWHDDNWKSVGSLSGRDH
jgi:hypothetical protein